MKHESPNSKRNIARFFTENRQIAWVALFATLAWGVFAYMNMPKRKDPDIPVRVGLAICPWPGIASDKVEQLVTRKIEQAATGNSKVDRVESTTQDNVSVVLVRLLDNIQNTKQEFQDIGQRLSQINDLPDGRGADHLDQRLRRHRGTHAHSGQSACASPLKSSCAPAACVRQSRIAVREIAKGRATVLYCYPPSVSSSVIEQPFRIFAEQAQRDGFAQNVAFLSVAGCSGIDFATQKSDEEMRAYGREFVEKRLQEYEFHPDAWGPIIIRDPQSTEAAYRGSGERPLFISATG